MIQNNKADFKTKKKIYKIDSTVYIFFKVSIRTNLLLLLTQFSLILAYVFGNYQNFLDSTQKLLLNVLEIISLMEVIFSLLSTVLNIVTAIMFKRKKVKIISYGLFYFLTLIGSSVTFFVSRALLLLSNGL